MMKTLAFLPLRNMVSPLLSASLPLQAQGRLHTPARGAGSVLEQHWGSGQGCGEGGCMYSSGLAKTSKIRTSFCPTTWPSMLGTAVQCPVSITWRCTQLEQIFLFAFLWHRELDRYLAEAFPSQKPSTVSVPSSPSWSHVLMRHPGHRHAELQEHHGACSSVLGISVQTQRDFTHSYVAAWLTPCNKEICHIITVHLGCSTRDYFNPVTALNGS